MVSSDVQTSALFVLKSVLEEIIVHLLEFPPNFRTLSQSASRQRSFDGLDGTDYLCACIINNTP